MPVGESFAARAQKIRILVFQSSKIYLKADKSNTLSVKGITSRESNIKSLTIQKDKEKLTYYINGDRSKLIHLPKDRNIIVSTRDPRGIWLGKRRYAGELRVLNSFNTIKVVNHLGLEKYLQSVVGSEMPKTWPLEALKAQAVAARTYALNQLKGKDYYDVDSSVSNQVYLGIEAETPRIRRAVRATRSLVITYKGKLIDAVFHSSSGGRTEESSFIWGRFMPYLVSVEDFDQESPHFSWSKKIDSKTLQKLFPEIGGVNTIRTLEQTTTNRVQKIKIYGPYGAKIISGKRLRSILDLKSTLVKFKILSSNQKENSSNNFFIESVKKKISLNKFNLVNSKKNIQFHQLDSLPELPEINYLLVEGSGSGHGAGMSQWGAKGLAERGNNFRRILRHFYTGVNITNRAVRSR